MLRILIIYLFVLLSTFLVQCNKLNPVEEFSDPKLFKQLLRTRTNVLVLFAQSQNAISGIYKAFKEAALEVRGIGTMVLIDCSGAGQKLCRQLKASPDQFVMHHYKDGKFHKVYDRQLATKSLVRFMNDPTGDRPWEEESTSKHVIHLDTPLSLSKLLKKHKRALVMFYAPWCVYCKQMKPEYAAAAATVRENGLGVLAAMDVHRGENTGMRTKYNITGFPTVHYFKNGVILATYEGENKQDKIVDFMKDPTTVPVKIKETPWSEEPSEVKHLTTNNFDQFIKDNPSTLVMFYAPWCGHCKNLKPEWVKAAEVGKSQLKFGVIAAVDATKETILSDRFKVKGFPTIKYFKDGELAFDTPNLRSWKKVIEFLQNPKEPPPAPPPEPAWEDVSSEVVHLSEFNFKTQLRSKRHALVMFYAPWCGHCKAAKPEFENAAEQLKEEPRMVLAAVNCVDNSAVCKLYDVKGYPTFKYFKYLKETSSYEGGRKAADFVNFFKNLEGGSWDIIQDSVPVSSQPSAIMEQKKLAEEKSTDEDALMDNSIIDELLHLTDDNYRRLMGEHKRLLVMLYGNGCSECPSARAVFDEVARKHNSGSSLVTLASCDLDQSPAVGAELLVDSLPTVKYIKDGKSILNYSGEITPNGLQEFIKNLKTHSKDEL